jgi:hypothetical protein
MMAWVRNAVVLACTFVLSGCINSGTLIKVKPDGSGTIEQTLLVNMQALKGLLSGLDAKGEVKQSGGVLNEAEFKRAAERMGVRPVSLTPMKENGFDGAKAVFAFDDINKVRVDQDPQMSKPGGAGNPSSSNNPIRFNLVRQGGSSVLTISVDEKSMADATKKAAPGGDSAAIPNLDPAMLGMIKAMFQGFRIAINLDIDGTIVKTNADYVAGSRITLLEVDAAGLFADESKLQALQSKIGPGMTLSEVRPLLKDIKGIKINHSVVTIEYR